MENRLLYLPLSTIPIVNLWIAYKLKIFKKFLVLFSVSFIVLNFVIGIFLDYPVNIILFLIIYIPIMICCTYKWSKERNNFKTFEREYIE